MTPLCSLRSLSLASNRIADFADVDKLACLTQLLELSLEHNPLTRRQGYRSSVLARLPYLQARGFCDTGCTHCIVVVLLTDCAPLLRCWMAKRCRQMKPQRQQGPCRARPLPRQAKLVRDWVKGRFWPRRSHSARTLLGKAWARAAWRSCGRRACRASTCSDLRACGCSAPHMIAQRGWGPAQMVGRPSRGVDDPRCL